MAAPGPSQHNAPAGKNQVAPAVSGAVPPASSETEGVSNNAPTDVKIEIPQPTAISSVDFPREILIDLDCLIGVSKVSWQQASNVDVLREHNLSRQYSIEDQSGQTLYYGGEKVGIICEFMGQGQRAFDINLYDINGTLVFKFRQPCSSKLLCYCAECGGGRVEVNSAGGFTMGTVTQVTTCCTPTYEIQDGNGTRVMMIVGKCGRVCCLCPSKAFRAFADVLKDDKVVTEVIATSGRRYVEFKDEITLEFKILLLAAMLLLEMDYYRSCRGLRRVLLIIMLIISGAAIYRAHILVRLDRKASP